MEWIDLTSTDQVSKIEKLSFEKPQIIFKHSTTCGISSVALDRFKKSDAIANADYYLLDLRKYRDVSQYIAEQFAVKHESPQVIVLKNGKPIYHESHFGIDMEEIMAALE